MPGEVGERNRRVEAFDSGWEEFWDPANQESVLIEQVLADPQLSLIVEPLGDRATRGAALRGQPVLHREVIECAVPN